MTRIFALPVTVIATAMATLAADPLAQNQSQEPDSFDIEPPVLKQNLTDQSLPTTEAPDGDVARLEKQLDRAKKNASGAERLCRSVGDEGRRGEVGLADLEVDDVTALPLELLCSREHVERRLRPEARECVGQARCRGRSHAGV